MTNSITLFQAIKNHDLFSLNGHIPFIRENIHSSDLPKKLHIEINEKYRGWLEDQEISTDTDGKIRITVTDRDTNKEEQFEVVFFKKSSLTQEENSSSIEQLKSDSANYRFLINLAEECGSFGIDGIGGAFEVYDESNAKEVDEAITQMRIKHESKKTGT